MPFYGFFELEDFFLDALDSAAQERANQAFSLISSDYNFSNVAMNDRKIEIGKEAISRWVTQDFHILEVYDSMDVDIAEVIWFSFNSVSSISFNASTDLHTTPQL